MNVVSATRGPTAAAALALLVAACGSGSTPRPESRNAASPSCVPTPVHDGAPPTWTAPAWSDSSPGFAVPYALASGNAAAAFFFAPSLRAGHPTDPANKVLWVVRFRRDGRPLNITARVGTDPSKVVRISRPADSSPGEIYPSYVDLPKPGCWRLELAWGPHQASLNVRVRSAGS